MDKKHVKVVIDRPLWTYHPKHKNIFYTLNYGYVEGVMWWDWEEHIQYSDLIKIHENRSGHVLHSLNVGSSINLKKISIVFDL